MLHEMCISTVVIINFIQLSFSNESREVFVTWKLQLLSTDMNLFNSSGNF